MDTKKLRQKILDLAIRGKLVPQDPNDEPASVLLERIRAEKEQLIKAGKIKRGKQTISDKPHYENVPFEIPESWEWINIEDLAIDMADGPFGSNLKASHYTNNREVRIIQLSNIGEEGWREENTKYTTFKHLKEISRSEVTPGDIIIAKMMPAGRAIICPNHEPAYVLSSDAVKLRPSKHINVRYLLYAINSPMFQQQVHDNVQGVTRLRTSIAKLKGYFIPLPPLSEQSKIVESIEQYIILIDSVGLDSLELQKHIEKCKTKILDYAIHGKLVPQDPKDEPAIELLKRIAPEFQPCDTSHYPNLPQGWTVCRLEDIVDYEQPTKYIVESTEYSDDYKTPVLTAGKSFILGYTNEENGVYNNVPTIIFDDFTTDSRYVDFPFKVKSSAMKIIQVRKEINIKYVACFMSITRLVGDTHKRYWISEYSKIPIPLPPRKEQDRIVEAIQSIENTIQKICDEL